MNIMPTLEMKDQRISGFILHWESDSCQVRVFLCTFKCGLCNCRMKRRAIHQLTIHTANLTQSERHQFMMIVGREVYAININSFCASQTRVSRYAIPFLLFRMLKKTTKYLFPVINILFLIDVKRISNHSLSLLNTTIHFIIIKSKIRC